MNNTIFCMRIPEIGVLVHPKHPDTTMFTRNGNRLQIKNSYNLTNCMQKLKTLGLLVE
jgi:hypothetical protein